MEFKRCEKGEKVHIPGHYVSKSGDGWITSVIPNDGLVIIMSTKEKALGGIFITDEQLAKLGYVHSNAKPLCAESKEDEEITEK
jgi:hypothetical protein